MANRRVLFGRVIVVIFLLVAVIGTLGYFNVLKNTYLTGLVFVKNSGLGEDMVKNESGIIVKAAGFDTPSAKGTNGTIEDGYLIVSVQNTLSKKIYCELKTSETILGNYHEFTKDVSVSPFVTELFRVPIKVVKGQKSDIDFGYTCS